MLFYTLLLQSQFCVAGGFGAATVKASLLLIQAFPALLAGVFVAFGSPTDMCVLSFSFFFFLLIMYGILVFQLENLRF